MKWLPMSDAPRDGTVVAVFDHFNGPSIARYDKGRHLKGSGRNYYKAAPGWEPEGWLPIPERFA